VSQQIFQIEVYSQYVLDGGALLQRILWSHVWRYLPSVYTEYVRRKYKNAVVVFDSYENMSAKNVSQHRRSKGKASTSVTVFANMTTTMKKEQFLVNKKEKKQFIFMLSAELEKSNCKTYHSPADGDLLIVQKAVQSATTNTTVLADDDADLIVLLCYHASLDSHDIFFCPEPRKNTKKVLQLEY